MSTVTIDVRDLPEKLAEVMRLVRSGTEVLVEEANIPIAKLVPCEPPRREFIFNMHPGAVIAPDFAAPLPDEFWAEST
jgi:antitoxin (DNA-binding transcriptional repressor) of toxin-antitoxin stability system